MIDGPPSCAERDPREHELKQLGILAVDDQEANLLLLQCVLERDGYTQVRVTSEPSRAAAMFVERPPDLVLLDLHMPEMDGFELMERLGALMEAGREAPFLVLTADVTEEIKRRALGLGARDFLTKPFDQTELLLRVRNLLQVKQRQDRLREKNANLQTDLDQARLEVLERLALATEYRDDETQEHAWRIGRTGALLALALDRPDGEVELIRRAAPLHDVGKIGIPDPILLKPGKLDEDEFAVIKTHPTIGGAILSGSPSPLLRLAEQIALTHHERWDGGGYPGGLSGERIPLVGRIVAVADVFDALTHERPYKEAWTVEKAVQEIVGQAGRQFDPGLVDAFSSLDHPALLRRPNESEPPPESRLSRSEAWLAVDG